jgi:hypothetical protein
MARVSLSAGTPDHLLRSSQDQALEIANLEADLIEAAEHALSAMTT